MTYENVGERVMLRTLSHVVAVDSHNGKQKIHLTAEMPNGYVIVIQINSSQRNSLQLFKMIGLSQEKFLRKYGDRIKKSDSSWRGSTETSNTSTMSPLTSITLDGDSVLQNATNGNTKSLKSDRDSSGR